MIKVEQTTTKTGRVRHQVHVDDEIFKENDYRRVDRRLWFMVNLGDQMDITVCEPGLIKKIVEHTFDQLPQKIGIVRFDVENFMGLDRSLIEADTDFSITQDEDGVQLYCALTLVSENWETPLSRAEFLVELYRRLIRHYEVTIFENSRDTGSRNNGLSIRHTVKHTESTIGAEISMHREQLRKILDRTVSHIAGTSRESLAVFFDFPESIKVACEQYLLYFGQFLNDLGVSATTSLTHETGQVLFTVTPSSREEALDKIRQALDLYLELASSPISDSKDESIAVQRLESSVLRLRSDLKLAAAELQAKDATIKAQNLMIGILNGEVLIDAVTDVSPKPEDKEDVIPGVVSLSTYKEKGLEIHLGEVFRRLKRFFLQD
jgi:hypothetical protein